MTSHRLYFCFLILSAKSILWGLHAKYELEEIFVAPGPDNQPTMIFTEPFLGRFDGSNPNEPIYVSIRGVVFDVTSELDNYSINATLHYLAGKDVSRAIAKNSTESSDMNDNLEGLTDEELENLDNMYKHYKRTFRIIGYMSQVALNEKIKNDMDIDDMKKATIRVRNSTDEDNKKKKKNKKKKNKKKKKSKDKKDKDPKDSTKKEGTASNNNECPHKSAKEGNIQKEANLHDKIPGSDEVKIDSTTVKLESSTVQPKNTFETSHESTTIRDSKPTIARSTKLPKLTANDYISKQNSKNVDDVRTNKIDSTKDYYVPYSEKPENDEYFDEYQQKWKENKIEL
ncbi:unnamed protein product [Gordionus sp. m RMFG-2023]|uniref:uncharacterized protein LOC135930824 n=1 Tax=Gordionus sp. m RMFG-2023 TaxID=3053472 RepID=UPI0030E1A2FA